MSACVLTLISRESLSEVLSRVRTLLESRSWHISTFRVLSEAEFQVWEVGIEAQEDPARPQGGTSFQELQPELRRLSDELKADIAIQPLTPWLRKKRLVVMDMDSTFIQCEVIDELAREKGVYDQVAAITHEAMMGNLEFDESLRRRVATLQGLTTQAMENVRARVRLTPGARDLVTTLQKMGIKIALVSGGFNFVAQHLKTTLGLHYAFANELEIQDGALTGKVIPPIVNAQRKAELLEKVAQEENIDLRASIAIGDGANDLMMLGKAGLGIAFNAKPKVREKADISINQNNLRIVLHLLGLSDQQIRNL